MLIKPSRFQCLLHVPPGLAHKISTFCSRSVFTCVVSISEETEVYSFKQR